ncbi:MAG TPA: carbohydrate-binding protein, partial [Bacillota bacterium]|nr:carbohydrate-binding protein [Bacillota bacterium]
GTPSRGDTVRLEYRGLLKESGADRVWLHYGFDGWKNPCYQQMERTPQGNFVCTTKIQGTREMNFCFKDSANNWDNNSGWNWTCKIK